MRLAEEKKRLAELVQQAKEEEVEERELAFFQVEARSEPIPEPPQEETPPPAEQPVAEEASSSEEDAPPAEGEEEEPQQQEPDVVIGGLFQQGSSQYSPYGSWWDDPRGGISQGSSYGRSGYSSADNSGWGTNSTSGPYTSEPGSNWYDGTRGRG